MRLNRYMALCGVASRRKCDEIIDEGRVTINGEEAHKGSRVEKNDVVKVDDEEIGTQDKAYYLFYKPLQVLTTLDDPRGRTTVAHYLKDIPYRLFPVGRLDFDSEGLLFLTNDGGLAHKIQHPKYLIEKEYLVDVEEALSPHQMQLFAKGVKLEEGTTAPCTIEMIAQDRQSTRYKVVLHQGWNRQIRRMFDVFEIEVQKLKRVRIGNLELGDLKPGELKELDESVLKDLRRDINKS